MAIDQAGDAPKAKRSRSNRWSTSTTSPESGKHVTTNKKPNDSKALAQNIAQRLAALKQKKLAALGGKSALTSIKGTADENDGKKRNISATISSVNNVSKNSEPSTAQSTKRAKVYDFDMTVISKPTSTFQKPKVIPKRNPYLAHRETNNVNSKDDEKNLKSNIADDDNEIILDSRLAGGQIEKKRKRHKGLVFIEPGTYIELAEKKREKAINAIQSGFTSGRKVGLHHTSVGITSSAISDKQGYYGHAGSTSASHNEDNDGSLPTRADCFPDDGNGAYLSNAGSVVPSSTIPLIMEWWDLELLPSKLKKEVALKEGQVMAKRTKDRINISQLQLSIKNTNNSTDSNSNNKSDKIDETGKEISSLQSKCFILASISNSKTSSLIQHPIPIYPIGYKPSDNAANNNSQSTVHLTKKEMKRQRKLRRAEKQREQQDLQAAGLMPPPEPKLTLSNFMRVMGNQAILDPSQMEKVVLEQIQSRKLKHEKMNEERKLSKEERSLKRKQKLLRENVDPTSSTCVSVALFFVKDMSHPYHRAKIDLNAQQMDITGGVLECFDDENNINLSLVIVEGGSKVIKKYIRLMTVRMKWKGEQLENESEEDDDVIDEGDNKTSPTTKVRTIKVRSISSFDSFCC